MDSIYNFLKYIKNSFVFYFCPFITNFKTLINNYNCKLIDQTIRRQVIFFDFETTGLNPYHEKIIEYAFLKGEGNKEEYIDSLVNPKKKFDKKVTDITGIHPDMLEEEKPIENHLDNIRDFIFENEKKNSQASVCLHETYLVAHNCFGFDKMFFERIMENKIHNRVLYIDTLALAKKLLPNRNSYSLSALAKTYRVAEGNHRALSDSTALRDIYNILLTELANRQKLTTEYFKHHPEHVYSYCQSSIY